MIHESLVHAATVALSPADRARHREHLAAFVLRERIRPAEVAQLDALDDFDAVRFEFERQAFMCFIDDDPSWRVWAAFVECRDLEAESRRLEQRFEVS